MMFEVFFGSVQLFIFTVRDSREEWMARSEAKLQGIAEKNVVYSSLLFPLRFYVILNLSFLPCDFSLLDFYSVYDFILIFTL